VKKLVYQDQVFALVGSIGSPTNAAVYKVLDEAKVPLLGMGTGSPIFYRPTLRYVFPAWPLYTTDGKTMGAFAKQRFANQSVAIIYQDDAFGKPIRDGILSQIGKAEMEIPYVPSQVDFSSAVIKMVMRSRIGCVLSKICSKWLLSSTFIEWRRRTLRD